MGTDIHACLEYAGKSQKVFSASPRKPANLFAHFKINRSYILFDALGNGRSSLFEPDEVEKKSLFPPRGIPADLSLDAAQKYYLGILDTKGSGSSFWPKDWSVTKEAAASLVKNNQSHYGTIYMHDDTSWKVVSDPKYHAPGWLTYPEIKASLAHFDLPLDNSVAEQENHLGWDFRLLMKTMEQLTKEIGEEKVRLTFWFDS